MSPLLTPDNEADSGSSTGGRPDYGHLRAAAGLTDLREVGLNDRQLERLRTLSVGSAEELLGLIRSDPRGSARYLGIDDVAAVQSRAAQRSFSAVQAIEGMSDAQFALGADPPSGDVPIEATEAGNAEGAMSALESVPGEGAPAVDLRGCFGAVRNQGQRGTCVAHAVTAVFECELNRAGRGLPDLSEQYLYFTAKQADGHSNRPGTLIQVAADVCLPSTGECLESLWVYNPAPIAGNEGQGPAPEPAINDALLRRAAGVAHNAQKIDEIKLALDQDHPVAISVPVYDNWFSNPATHLYGFIPMPLPLSALKGGHAVVAAGYGYDPDFSGGGYFIIRNSWGTGWAPSSPIEAGYGVLPFAYLAGYGWEAYGLTLI